MATNDWKIFAAENIKIESIFVPKIKTAIKKQYSSFIDDLQTFGIDYATRRLTVFAWNADLTPTLRQLYRQAGLRGAVSEYSHLLTTIKDKPKFRGFGFNEIWTQEVIDYLQLHILDKAVLPITETTRAFILRVIELGVKEGWGIDRMVAKIRDDQILEARARMIARTETIRAANIGHKVGAKNFPYQVTKGWIAANDHRTRHTHRLVNGQWVEEDEKFSNGLLFPGDPEAPAKEVINCRCRVIYKAKRDKQGRIIPRTTDPLQTALKSFYEVLSDL
ncbi:MAG: phage minor head protein [Agriterribacter sp.]